MWYVGQRVDSHPGWDGSRWCEISSFYSEVHNIKFEFFFEFSI